MLAGDETLFWPPAAPVDNLYVLSKVLAICRKRSHVPVNNFCFDIPHLGDFLFGEVEDCLPSLLLLLLMLLLLLLLTSVNYTRRL